MRVDKVMSILWAREVQSDPKAVYLDTETNGTDTGAEAAEIAILDYRGNLIFQCRMRTAYPIPPEVSAINHIEDSELDGLPRWSSYNDLINDLLTGRRVVTYNAAFDSQILSQTHSICMDAHSSRYSDSFRFDCAMLHFAAYVGEPSQYRDGEHRWQKLPDVGGGKPHTAYGDCLWTLEIVRRMAATAIPGEPIPEEKPERCQLCGTIGVWPATTPGETWKCRLCWIEL